MSFIVYQFMGSQHFGQWVFEIECLVKIIFYLDFCSMSVCLFQTFSLILVYIPRVKYLNILD